MKYVIFDIEKHERFIPSFLKSMAVGHNEEKKSIEWFHWKFLQKPLGRVITVIAISEEEQVIGAVAYGLHSWKSKFNEISIAMAFENFVHPDYRRKGIFMNLKNLIFEELNTMDIDVFVSFPNDMSKPSFLKLNWELVELPVYYLQVKSFVNVLKNFSHLKKGFIPDPSDGKKIQLINDNSILVPELNDLIFFNINHDYLQWRFNGSSINKYSSVISDNVTAIFRIGSRGSLKEAQLLYHFSSNKEYKMNNRIIKSLISELLKIEQIDMIGYPIGINNHIVKTVRKLGALPVPSKASMALKIINPQYNKEQILKKLQLMAINYHTY